MDSEASSGRDHVWNTCMPKDNVFMCIFVDKENKQIEKKKDAFMNESVQRYFQIIQRIFQSVGGKATCSH